MVELADIHARICDEARQSGAIGEFRRRMLSLLAELVAFDVGLFHELSPRVPLSRAATVGLELAAIERSRGSWDRLAVTLAVLREHALARGGVATTADALARNTSARRAWSREVAPMLGAPEAMLMHLVVDDRIVSAVVLGRRRGGFAAFEQELVRALVPSLSVCDALRQTLEDHERRGLVAELRCVDQRLTTRQRELVLLVALGHTDHDIAQALGISANTVRNHLVDVRRRLGAANRAEIVRLAVLR